MKVAYKRWVIHRDKNCELVAILWPPGVSSPPHDHGQSRGAALVIQGRVFAEDYSKRTKKFIGSNTYRVGQYLSEDPAVIHVVGNASKIRQAVTLHLYTPPLKMKFYDPSELRPSAMKKKVLRCDKCEKVLRGDILKWAKILGTKKVLCKKCSGVFGHF